MGMVGIQVYGLRELDGRLARLDGYQGQRVRQVALQAGARALVSPMRREAPQGATGILRRAVGARPGRNQATGRDPDVMVVGSTARHRHLVIRGTGLRTTTSGANRGRMPSNPFVDRAWQANRGRVLDAIEKRYALEVKKLWG